MGILKFVDDSTPSYFSSHCPLSGVALKSYLKMWSRHNIVSFLHPPSACLE